MDGQVEERGREERRDGMRQSEARREKREGGRGKREEGREKRGHTYTEA